MNLFHNDEDNDDDEDDDEDDRARVVAPVTQRAMKWHPDPKS